MQARFIRLEWENTAHTIASLYIKPDKPYYFTAGQYADLTIPHDAADSRGMTRTMTIASSPSEKLIRMTMRFPDRSSTYKQAILKLQPNAPVALTDAMGDLVLPLDSSTPLVFVAGGVAMASYASMLQWLIEQKDRRDITLLYAVRNTDDIICEKILDVYDSIGNLKRILFTTDNKADRISWKGSILKRRLTARDIMDHAGSDAQIYLSGSERMVNDLQGELQKKYHIPQYRIAFDYFEGYTEV